VNKSKNADESQPQDPQGGDTPGSGALCPEAQADGVPCFEIGKDCEVCEKATPFWRNLRRDSEG
jgi:hypothetical protein